MRHSRYASACLAAAITLSLLTSCKGTEGPSAMTDQPHHGSTVAPDHNGDSQTGNSVTTPSKGDTTTIIGGTVIEPSTGDSSATAQPETAPETTPAEDPTEGAYTPTGETVIVLGDTASVEGQGATVDGSVVTITNAGTYLISGTANNGQIIVDTADESKVTLLLNGASLSCADGPAVYVKSAPKKVVISTVEGSVNILSDGTGYVVPDDQQTESGNYPNACIYSCEELELDGSG